MPTQEEIDNYNSIKADGTLATLPIATQLKIADRFNDRLTVKTGSFEVPNSGGVIKETTKTIRANNERNTGFIEQDQTPGLFNLFGMIGPKREDLSQPIEETRTFIPDVRNIENKRTGAITQETGFNPLTESVKETLGENMTAMSRATGIPFLLEKSGLVKNFNQEFAGLTDKEYEEIPALQKFAASIPADIATGEVLGGAVRALGKIPVGKKTLGHVIAGNVGSFTEKGQRLLRYQQRQVQISSETLDQFVKKSGGLTKEVAEKAVAEGFPLKGTSVKELKRALKVNEASQGAGQRGMLRSMGMTEKEAKDIIGAKMGFRPSDKAAQIPVPTLTGPNIEKTIKETAEEIAQKYGSGTPDMSKFQVADPTKLGGAPTKDKVFNLNLRQIPAKEEDLRGTVQQMAELNRGILEGGRSLGDEPLTRELADTLNQQSGLTLDDLTMRQMGQAWNGLESRFLHKELGRKAQDLAAFAKKLDPTNEAEQLAWVKEAMNFSALQSTTKGGLSEAARAMNMAKMVSSKEALKEKTVKQLFGALNGPEDWNKALELFKRVDPDDIQGINSFIENLHKSTFDKVKDGAFYVWVNSVLSGPMTQVRNALGNTITATFSPIEKTAAGGIQAARSLVSGGIERDRFMLEGAHQAVGMAQGLKDGARGFLKAFKTGVSSYGGDKFGIAPISPIPGKIGEAIGLPGRALLAFDEFFKTINYSGAINSLAYRQAMKEGVKGSAIPTRMAQLVSKPTRKMITEATSDAAYRTFTKDLGSTGKAFQLFSKQVPGMRYVVPFVKTPVNVFKYGMERTPLGLLQLGKQANRASGVVDDVVAKAFLGTTALVGGGLGGIKAIKEIGEGKKHRASSQPDAKAISVGSLLGGGIAQVFAEGGITGGAPVDPEERKVFYASGKKPYSVRIGDNWVQYNLEPFGTSIGGMVDMLQIWDSLETEDAALASGFSIAKNFTNKAFMQGLSNMMDAWSDPGRHGAKFARQMATGFVPYSGLLRSVNNAIDPVLRSPETMGETFTGIIPGQRDKLPPIYDIWGEPVTSEGSPLERAISPVRRSKVVNDKATQEVDRLNVRPGSIKRAVGELELESPIYHMAQQIRGQTAKKFIDKAVNSPGWDKALDSTKTDILEKMFQKAGQIARAQLLTTATNAQAKAIIKGIEIAKEQKDSVKEADLRNKLQVILDKDIIKLKGKEP